MLLKSDCRFAYRVFCPVSVLTSACSVRTLARRVPFSLCNRSRLGERAKPRGESVMAMLKTKETLEEM